MAATTPLKSLGPTHLAAARMRAEGRPNSEIRAELKVANRTLHNWFSDPKMKEEVDRLVSSIQERFVEKISGYALYSLDKLQELLAEAGDSPPTVEQKIKIAEIFLQRHPMTAIAGPQTPDGAPGSPTVNIFAQMTDEQLKARARELSGAPIDTTGKSVNGNSGD